MLHKNKIIDLTNISCYIFNIVPLFEEKINMPTNTIEEITIQIDSDAAKAYKAAAPELKLKIQLLFSAWLKEVTSKDKVSLKQLMDNVSDNAQARGLITKNLETILSEN